MNGDCFSVTIAVEGRLDIFRDPQRAGIAITALRRAAEKYDARVFAYCLMPDHMHILTAMPPGVSLVDFVRQFKQLSAFRLKRLAGKPVAVWQARFFDHGLRAEEAIEDVASYIMENPVRAGIASRADDYPFSGSLNLEGGLSGSEDPDLRGMVHTR
jgi:REP element-mobilizing transposase RayT